MRSRGTRALVALNTVVTLVLITLIMARFVPGARTVLQATFPHFTLGHSGATTLTISGPGVGAAARITNYILGDVASPGVYTLAAGARVQDLVEAAGGARADADMTQVNLAARLADGQEVYVPRVGESVPLTLGGKVDINRFSEYERTKVYILV
jgi:hypothetical protein